MGKWLWIEFEHEGRKGSYKTTLAYKSIEQIIKETRAAFKIKDITLLGYHVA